jgi:hypothetical protein
LTPATAICDYEYLRGLPRPIQDARDRNKASLDAVFGDYVGSFYSHPHGCAWLPAGAQHPSDQLRELLRVRLPAWLTYTPTERQRYHEEYLRGDSPRYITSNIDIYARFLVAAFGGLMLVVPTLIMSLPQATVTKSLVIISIAVLVFGGSVSLFFRANDKETMMATATYAAVLVVFLGVSMEGSSVAQGPPIMAGS